MRLSIVNYPKSISPKMKTTVTNEDEELLKLSRERVEEMNYGRGALIISEVLHTDLANLNNRVYKKKGMFESAQSFVEPYPTPFIMHHDMGGGGMFGGGDPKLIANGSNVVANYYARRTETANGIASGYVKVGTFIPESAMIGNQRVIDAIQARQLYALSIGASVQESNHRCSICGKPVFSEECEHRPGQIYEGVKCLSEIYSPLFKEYSAVYNPSDVVAAIRRMDLSEGETNPLFANECRTIDNGFNVCEIAMYDLSAKLYASSGIASNTQTKEEGHQATMNTKDIQPAAPTAPQTTSDVAIDETTASHAPVPVVAPHDAIVAKALDIVAERCAKSDEVIAVALSTIKDMVGVIGDLRVGKTDTVTTASESTSTETSSSVEPDATKPESETSTEETTSSAETTEPENATPEKPEVATEESTEEKPATDEATTTTETAPETSETQETSSSEETSQNVSTTETASSDQSSGNSLAMALAKRRACAGVKKKSGFVKKPGRRF